jgi:predicted TIM-barrel fold metal-dependent hydrolase
LPGRPAALVCFNAMNGTPRVAVAIHTLRRRPLVIAFAGVGLIAVLATVSTAADYRGPIIDAHSHLPNPTAIEAYVEAMKRHNFVKVVLLGAGGVQKHDRAWIAEAARKHPTRVIPGLPLPNPTSDAAAERLESVLAKTGARVIGEVHIRHASRKIDRDPGDGAFSRVLDVAGKRGVPVVIHDELDDRAAAALAAALASHPNTTVILAHGGSATPAQLESLLGRHPNLLVDLSGLHFQRAPGLSLENGPLAPPWKALINKMPERFLTGLDIWAPRLFETEMLDRLMTWTRRMLGELRRDAAERVAYRNAATLFQVE